MRQSRVMSLVEAATNVVVGYGLAVLVQIAVFPVFGIAATLKQNLAIGLVFTLVSLGRSYMLRRLFENGLPAGLATVPRPREHAAHATRLPAPCPAAALGESLTARLRIVLATTRLTKLSLYGALRGAATFGAEGHPCGRRLRPLSASSGLDHPSDHLRPFPLSPLCYRGSHCLCGGGGQISPRFDWEARGAVDVP